MVMHFFHAVPYFYLVARGIGFSHRHEWQLNSVGSAVVGLRKGIVGMPKSLAGEIRYHDQIVVRGAVHSMLTFVALCLRRASYRDGRQAGA
jgi:hypothetical protein